MIYEIKRNGYTITEVRPDSGYQQKEVMQQDIVKIDIKVPNSIHFEHGDSVDVYGETYTLNDWADITKESSLTFKYSLTFQAQWYALAKPKFRFYDSENKLTQRQFEVKTDLEGFLDLVVANANRSQSGWIKGSFENTDAKLLTFNGENVLLAINQIAEAFNTEWWVANKVIHFTKKGVVSGLGFEYGRGKGLWGGLERSNVNTSSVFSRLYAYGSEQNIPADYKGGLLNLTLPGTPGYIQGPLYGKEEIENDIVFDDIRPERIGTITSVGDIYTFTDTGIDFDLNAQVYRDSEGTIIVSPKVSFLTGKLAGYSFDIAKAGYKHPTKTVTFLRNEQEKAFILPSEELHPEVGDTYFFVDLRMPDSYIAAAEARLKVKAQEYFDKYSKPIVSYKVKPDVIYLKTNGVTLTLGDSVHIRDFDLLVDNDIRVVGYQRDLHEGYLYPEMKLSTVVMASAINREFAEAEKTNKALEINKVFDIERSRKNWKTTNEVAALLETLRAEMLLIKIDGGSFSTTINASATSSAFTTTTGQLIQEEYMGATNGIWQVPAANFPLTVDGPQYAYIKASKTSTGAEIVISPTRIGVEDVTAFYHFPFVIVSSINNGGRAVTKIYSRTSITGGQVATGEIVSNNGLSNINLDHGTFNFINQLARIAFTDEGVKLEGKIIATNAEFVNLFIQNLKTSATGKRVQITAETNNIQILNASGQVLLEADDDSAIEGTYWSYTPPLVLQPGDIYPKNYLGSFNDASQQMRYYYATMGAGVSVGVSPTDSNGFSSMGRKEFFTNGKFRAANASGSQQTSIDQYGVVTTGLLDAAGNAILRGNLNVIGKTSANGVPYIDFQGDVRMGGGDFYRMTWRNGGLISAVQNPN